MQRKIKSLFERARRRKADLLFVLLWSIIFSVVVIKVYLAAYLRILRLSYFQIPFASYDGPAPDILDMLIIAVISLIAGFFLHDIKDMLFGYVATVSLAFIVGVAFVSFYIWGPLGWGELFSLGPYEWEWALLLAVWNVFRIMFPLLVAISLISVIIGAFTKELVA